MNPVIYAKFNRDFRRPFQEFLKCHCLDVNKRLREEEYREKYGSPVKRIPGLGSSGNVAGLRLTKAMQNDSVQITRREAEEGGLLHKCAKFGKIPVEHMRIMGAGNNVGSEHNNYHGI